MRSHLSIALAASVAALAFATPAWARGAAPESRISEPARRLVNWVTTSRDNGDGPFVVIDKAAARVFVHGADGTLIGQSDALLGFAPGDDSSPGIGDRELEAIQPEERTTPAGRFVASYGPAEGQADVFWVDYANAISLHPVPTGKSEERRLQRLASPSPEDNRITYGCINVPADFYTRVVEATFKGRKSLVYILPETRPLAEVFPGTVTSAQAWSATQATTPAAATAAAQPEDDVRMRLQLRPRPFQNRTF